MTGAALRCFAKGESRIHPHVAFLGGDESQPSLPRGEPGRAAGLELCEPAAWGRGFRGACPGLSGLGPAPAVRSQGSPRSIRRAPGAGGAALPACSAARDVSGAEVSFPRSWGRAGAVDELICYWGVVLALHSFCFPFV